MRVAGLFVLLSVCLVHGESATPQSEPVKKSNLVVSSTKSQLPFYLRQEAVFQGPQDKDPRIKWEPLRRDIYAQLLFLGNFGRRGVCAIRYIMDEDLDKNRDWAIGVMILLETADSPGYYTPVYFASDSKGRTDDYTVSNVLQTDIGPAVMIGQKKVLGPEEWELLKPSSNWQSCEVVSPVFSEDDPLSNLKAEGWLKVHGKTPVADSGYFHLSTLTKEFSIFKDREAPERSQYATAVVQYRWKDGKLVASEAVLTKER